MNNKVTELINRSRRQSMWPGDPDGGSIDEHLLAVLIVKECITVARQADNDDMVYAWFAIEKHFGVE